MGLRESAPSKPLDVGRLSMEGVEVRHGIQGRGTLDGPAVAELLPMEPQLHLPLGHSELDQRVEAVWLRGRELQGAFLIDLQAATAIAAHPEVDILVVGRGAALETEADYEGLVGLPRAEEETSGRESGAHLDAV